MGLIEEPEREVHRTNGIADKDGCSQRSSPTPGCPEVSPIMKATPESSPSSSSSPAVSSPASLQEMFQQQGRALARWKKEDPSFVVQSIHHQYHHFDHDKEDVYSTSSSDERAFDEVDDDDGTWSGSYYKSECYNEGAQSSQNVDYLSVVSSEQNQRQRDDDFSLPSSIIDLQARVNIFDVMTLQTEEDSSFCFDAEGTDSDIQQAITDIRREASQMDAVMALDQLRTFQSELDVVTKQFQARSREAEDLRIRVAQSEERAAQLELERDLHQADASKLREDLKTCIERMFDISIVAGQSVLDSDDFETHNDEDVKPEKTSLLPLKEQLQQLAFGETACGVFVPNDYVPSVRRPPVSPEQVNMFDLSEQLRSGDQSVSTESGPALISIECESDWSECSDGVHLLATPRKVGSESRNQDVFRRRGYANSLLRPRKESTRMQKRQVTDSSSSRGGHRSLSVETKRQRNSLQTVHSEGHKNLCGLFSRRSKRESVCREKDTAIMQNQIIQLHLMLKKALAGSEKLRKRLATISNYYEGVTRTLQDQVAEMKVEKSKTEIEMRDKLQNAELDKKMMVSRLTSELRKRDEEIAIMKLGIDVGEV
jgi:hypothetical protein